MEGPDDDDYQMNNMQKCRQLFTIFGGIFLWDLLAVIEFDCA